MFLYDIIIKSAQAQLKAQNSNGSMPAGNNGPWGDRDTPVRNTAHWALILYKAYEISKEARFLKAALSACDYLLSKEARPHNASFLCRWSETRDKANGLIGQAWAIEPLVFMGKELRRKDYLSIAEEVLLKHKYDEKTHLWHNLGIDGNAGEVNPVFNQQLWFAVMNLLAGKENNNHELLCRSKDFFKHINKNLFFLAPGLIRHEIPQGVIKFSSLDALSRLKACIKRALRGEDYPARIKELSLGSLSFNLYALALGYANAPDEKCWHRKWFKKMILGIINYIQKGQFIKESYKNPYLWSYNPFGFEIAYALAVFKNLLAVDGSVPTLRTWVERQFSEHWNPSTSLMDNHTTDTLTLSARLYEASRLPNIELSLHIPQANLKAEKMETVNEL